MNQEHVLEQLFQTLVTGDRTAARQLVAETEAAGLDPRDLTHDILWPSLDMVCSLYRSDQLTTLAHHYATRLLRSLVDQAGMKYQRHEPRGKSIVLFTGPGEADELAGQILADLAEAEGYDVFFAGGGIANDEILAEVGNRRPDTLLLFASAPSDAPHIRQLIDSIRGVGACPEMQIVVGGGVFARADGLAEEIGADLWAHSPREVLERLEHESDRRATPDQRTVGRNRRTAAA